MKDSMKFKNTVKVSVIRDGVEIFRDQIENLITNAGRNWLAEIMGNAQAAPAAYMAITSNSSAPSATETTLTDEYTTNGLARALGTYAHTTDTDNFTLEKTWTSTADSQAVFKAALFNAATAGTMFAVALLSSSVTLMTNDQLKITWTIDFGL